MLRECGHPSSLFFPRSVCPVCCGLQGFGWTWLSPSNSWYRHPDKRKGRMALKKPVIAVTGVSDLTGIPDQEFLRDFPSLAEAIFCRVNPDKTKRETHSLLLCEGDGAWKCLIRDNQEQAQCWITASVLTELLLRANACIETALGDWRPTPGVKKPYRRGR